MEDLIKALNIFLKYGNPTYPTHCTNEELYIDINPGLVSESDLKELKKLSFGICSESIGFSSFKYGSC